MVIVTSAVAFEQGAFDTVQRNTIGPVPPVWVKVALGAVALEKVPVPPLMTDHMPVAPPDGVLPPSPAVVPPAQIVCGPPAVAVGDCLTVIVTSANEAVHGGLEIVQRRTMVPGPLVGVKVAFGVVASGLKLPVAPPVTIDHWPLPDEGMLPPSPNVVLPAQIVWFAPTVA